MMLERKNNIIQYILSKLPGRHISAESYWQLEIWVLSQKKNAKGEVLIWSYCVSGNKGMGMDVVTYKYNGQREEDLNLILQTLSI